MQILNNVSDKGNIRDEIMHFLYEHHHYYFYYTHISIEGKSERVFVRETGSWRRGNTQFVVA